MTPCSGAVNEGFCATGTSSGINAEETDDSCLTVTGSVCGWISVGKSPLNSSLLALIPVKVETSIPMPFAFKVCSSP